MRALLVLVIVVCALASCAPADRSDSNSSGSSATGTRSSTTATTERGGGEATEDLETVTIDASGGERVTVRVEVADGPFEQSRGLMYRTALAEDRGMLFVYDDEQVRSFWMRNTLIPLSIAYLGSGGRIVDIQDMKPLDDKPPHYVSAKPAQYALEVNRGFFEERGVEVGDRAELPE